MRQIRKILCLILLLTSVLPLRAQFYLFGDDPGSLHWSQIRTSSYRIVYPRGMDSLARAYALSLEGWREAVGASVGFLPNQNYKKPMPVLLHPYSVMSNGSVAWAPRQMNLITTPDAYCGLPQMWTEQLTVHESRHVAQMQFCNWRGFKVPSIIFGQLWAGAMSAVYPGPAFLEGDAVAAETELSAAGRGRSGDFLEYYRVCSARGRHRDWWQWRYGSQKYYTPDYYRIGYFTIAGARDFFDCPYFSALYFQRIFKKGLPFWNFQKTMKEASGKGSFKEAFNVICDSTEAVWSRDRERRGPFMQYTQISATPARYTAYKGLAAVGNDIYSVRAGITSTATLVRTDHRGHDRAIHKLQSATSGLKTGGGRLFWSETRPDLRWGMRSYSVINTLKNGHIRQLSHKSRYFNPAPSADGKRLAATEYPPQGGSALVLLDPDDGTLLERIAAPDGIQLMESVWLEDTLLVSAINENGFGIFKVTDTLTNVLPCTFASIKTPFSHNGHIYFTSDRDGVGELYRLDGNSAQRITNTPFGAADFQFSGDSLFFTVPDTDGKLIQATAVDSLPDRWDDPATVTLHKTADRLSSRQRPAFDAKATVSEARPYRKGANLMRFHSWAPVYVNIDNIDKISLDNYYYVAGAGVTGFFQNDLGTLSGTAGAHLNLIDIKHSGGYARITYSGLFPVFEASVDGNSRNAWTMVVNKISDNDNGSIEGSLRAYVPFNLSGNGWSRGIIPQAKFTISNDRIYNSPDDDGVPYMELNTSLRAYTMQYVAPSCIYPRFGIGVEGGYSTLLGLGERKSAVYYGRAYGYLPGFFPTHGIRLEAFGSNRSAYVSIDYALPFAPVDWSALCPVAYIRNFEIIPHAEYNWQYGQTGSAPGKPFRYGADLMIRFENLLWIPYTTRMGVRVRNTEVSFLFGINI